MGLGKTLAEIEAIDKDELFGWMAFYQIEPWGCPVEDQRAATGLDLLYAINSKPGTKHPQWFDRGERGVEAGPTPEETEENIRDFFMGKTIKVASAPANKPRKTRSDKGGKRSKTVDPKPPS